MRSVGYIQGNIPRHHRIRWKLRRLTNDLSELESLDTHGEFKNTGQLDSVATAS